MSDDQNDYTLPTDEDPDFEPEVFDDDTRPEGEAEPVPGDEFDGDAA